jgi:parallel beta-helix repeat protein
MEGVRRLELPGGTVGNRVIYESYSNESVVFDGALLSRETEERREGKVYLEGSHISFRKIEIKNMPEFGIRILGNYNTVEGCIIHNNGLTGIEIYNGVEGFSNTPSGGSYNIVRNNKVYGNSDEGLTHGNYADGGNADGVNIISGVDNIIENNVIYNNSDDGIDTYKSFGTKVDYNLVYGQGIAAGNGNGLKLGGLSAGGVRGINIYARHNIVYQNRNNGITVHGANNNVTIGYNSSFNNGKAGYTSLVDTKLNHNFSLNNNHTDSISNSIVQNNNSWQGEGDISVISINPSTSELDSINITTDSFLRPIEASNSEDFGAYSTVVIEL